jgi:hypothetical protein
MKTSDVAKLYGSDVAIAKVAGCSRVAVGKWGDVVPLESAVALEIASAGALVVDTKRYPRLEAARVYAKAEALRLVAERARWGRGKTADARA